MEILDSLIAEALATRPTAQLERWRRENENNMDRGLSLVEQARKRGIPTLVGALRIKTNKHDYGLVSLRVVTDAGVAAIVDAFQGNFTLSNFRYHGLGVGNTAEDATDTELDSELTTEYGTNSTRATGTVTEGSSANIFRSVGTNSIDADSTAVVEHGLFSNATVGQGVLLDRSVFSAINLDDGDDIETTYELTFTSGS